MNYFAKQPEPLEPEHESFGNQESPDARREALAVELRRWLGDDVPESIDIIVDAVLGEE